MRHLVVVYILGSIPKGQVIQLPKLYSHIYSRFPKECHQLGFMGKLIKHVGTPKSGEWKRI